MHEPEPLRVTAETPGSILDRRHSEGFVWRWKSHRADIAA